MTRGVARPGAWLFAIALVVSLAAAADAADVPYLTGRVVDNAEILKPATRERVAALAKAHEDKTTDQIAVLTIPTLGGDSVEEFANRVFAAWKLGQKGKDNGVLVVVAPQDRKMRIEVGYGLEGTLTDVAASRIIRNVMTPAFKNSDFDRGIEDGVAAIVAQLEGQPATAGPLQRSSMNRRAARANPRSRSRDPRSRGTCGSCSDASSSASSASSPSSA
jgi:uncharacterized protein